MSDTGKERAEKAFPFEHNGTHLDDVRIKNLRYAYEDGYERGWNEAREVTEPMVERTPKALFLAFGFPATEWAQVDTESHALYHKHARAILAAALSERTANA
jgi:hypothetical protein